MSKKDKIKTIEVDDVNLVPELLDGNHRVIQIGRASCRERV